ncbi:MAG: hypothetical protein ABSA53_23530 [Streptosporangiaceae bacterium]|jgi:hypothetical protein
MVGAIAVSTEGHNEQQPDAYQQALAANPVGQSPGAQSADDRSDQDRGDRHFLAERAEVEGPCQ